MNILLIFFIFPLATIIISVIMEKVLNNPIAVAAFIFAFAIVIVFIAFDASDLIFAIVYTILAYIVAVITCLITRMCNNNNQDDEEDDDNSLCNCLRDSNINNDNVVNNFNNSINHGYIRGRRF